MSFEDYGKTLAYEIAFWSQGLSDPYLPLNELGQLSLEVSARFRTMAIMMLLVRGDTDRFLHNLIRSGRARETYLRRCESENVLEDHHRSAGRFDALVDAIAAGDLELASRLDGLSPTGFRTGHEYEDDFCYARLLGSLVDGSDDRQEAIGVLLEQFDAYEAGNPNARLDVSRALAARDQADFDEAFEDLLIMRELETQAGKDRGQIESPSVLAERRVFVEGLAILRLAETIGLETEQDYRFCPSLARIPMTEPFPGE